VKRTLILIAVLGAIAGLAFLVARPSREPPAATPYVGERGASRSKASGLAVAVGRGTDRIPIAPGTPVRPGDVLHLAVRIEHPRYLLVLMRDAGSAATIVFPVGGARDAQLVRPGEALPVSPVIGPASGKVYLTAMFADQAFAFGSHEARIETIDLVMEKEAAP